MPMAGPGPLLPIVQILNLLAELQGRLPLIGERRNTNRVHKTKKFLISVRGAVRPSTLDG